MITDKVPDGWPRVKFGDVVRNVNENSRDLHADCVDRVVGLDHLDPGSLNLERWDVLADLSDGTTFTRRFKPGQVLFGKRRAYQRKVAVANFGGVCSGDILVFEPADTRMLTEYLPYLVQSDGFFDHALGTSAGSLSPRTKWTELAKYEFALPSLVEQQRIVEVLAASGSVEQSEGAAFVASVSEVSALLRSMTESGESTTLGALAGSGIQIGPFGSQLHVSDYAVDGVPVLMPADLRKRGLDTSEIRYVDESKARELSSHRLREGDIVLPRRGELDKRALISVAEVGWLCGTGSVRVRLQDPALAPLVLEILASRESVQWLSENSVGTTMPNINRDIVARIPLRLPAAVSRALWVKRLSAARVVSQALVESMRMSVRRTASLREVLLEGNRVQ